MVDGRWMDGKTDGWMGRSDSRLSPGRIHMQMPMVSQ